MYLTRRVIWLNSKGKKYGLTVWSPYMWVRLLCPWGVSRQEYWSGLPCPPPGDLPNLGIEPRSSTLQEGSLPSEPPRKSKNTKEVAIPSPNVFPLCPPMSPVSSSSGSSQSRDRTGVSSVGGVFFTSWATREANAYIYIYKF